MTPELNPEIEEVIEVEKPPLPSAGKGFLDWCTFAVEDMAVAVERLNKDIDDSRNNNVIWNDVLDILSLRRWSFILPGGGAVRGGRRTRTRIRPAQPTQVQSRRTVSTQKPSSETIVTTIK